MVTDSSIENRSPDNEGAIGSNLTIDETGGQQAEADWDRTSSQSDSSSEEGEVNRASVLGQHAGRPEAAEGGAAGGVNPNRTTLNVYDADYSTSKRIKTLSPKTSKERTMGANHSTQTD